MDTKNEELGNSSSEGMNVNEFLSEVEEANSFQSNKKKVELRDHTYNPKTGTGVDDLIRVVPPLEGKAFQRLFIHWNVGRSKLAVCPSKNYGRPCPICEHIDSTTPKNEDEENQLKRMEAKSRNFLPVIIRGKEHEGVKWWGFPKKVLNDIAAIYRNKFFGDISHITTGRDLSLTSPNGNDSFTIIADPQVTPLAQTPEQIEAIRKSLLPISEVFLELPYKSLDKIIKRATGVAIEKGPPNPNTPGTEYGA